MKITINNKITTIDLTKHNWSLEKQFEKFLGEWEEFIEAYKVDISLPFDQYKYNVIQEGIDVIKSGCSVILICDADIYKMERSKKGDIPYVDLFENMELIMEYIERYKDKATELSMITSYMFHFLYDFCLENNEDLIEHIKINNDKTNGRGTDKKMYFNEIEESILFQIHELLIEDNHFAHAEDFKNMLDRIEE